MSKKRKPILLSCINCNRALEETEFLEEEKGYSWQYTRRCKLCERKYQQDFIERYPRTKRKHKLPFLSKEEELLYEKIIKEKFGRE